MIAIKRVELLAPAGNLEKLKAALIYGADAVYVGGKHFSLRAFGDNFSDDELIEAVAFAHALDRKIYVAVNIFAHNDDLERAADYIAFLDRIGIDAILISDLGLFSIAKSSVKRTQLHVSTQANTTNWQAVNAWHELGASRIVLARELSFDEIKCIRQRSTVELEMFVHGAMCLSYSGRCWLSHYLTGRDGNQGRCTHSCRWKYSLVEETRPDQYFDVGEDERGAYVMNSKDLCLLGCLDRVIESGVDSLKIEGRMKSVHYVASTVKVYRQAIDEYYAAPDRFKLRAEWIAELDKTAHRPFTTGFFIDDPDGTMITSQSKSDRTAQFLGIVREYDRATGEALVEQRGKMEVGRLIEVLQPTGATFTQRLESMSDEEGNPIDAAPHAQQLVKIKTAREVERWSLLRTGDAL